MLSLLVAKFQGRSGAWPRVRDQFLLVHPNCAACGTAKKLDVHHVIPFHLDQAKELDPENLITLCRRCHFTFGHFYDWTHCNPAVAEDARNWLTRITAYKKKQEARSEPRGTPQEPEEE